MSKHEHRYERLSDDAIFCACGEIRTAADATCSREHYPPVIWWSQPPYTVPYTSPNIYPTWKVTSGTTTVNTGPDGLRTVSTYAPDGTEQSTYTVRS